MTKPNNHLNAITPDNAQSNTVQSGIILPSDIRVRLVRAEAASLDTILSLLYSTVLSIFSLFLGIVLTKGSASTVTEKASVICFGALSAFLLGWWIYVKWKQSEKGVSVPHSVLQEFD
jgi:hypothetical protein